jgi:hypothetical protein
LLLSLQSGAKSARIERLESEVLHLRAKADRQQASHSAQVQELQQKHTGLVCEHERLVRRCRAAERDAAGAEVRACVLALVLLLGVTASGGVTVGEAWPLTTHLCFSCAQAARDAKQEELALVHQQMSKMKVSSSHTHVQYLSTLHRSPSCDLLTVRSLGQQAQQSN